MIFKYWGNECIVYHPASGNTHCLSTAHAKLLEIIRKPLTKKAIIAEILSSSIASDEDSAEALVEQATTTFNQLDLLD